MMNLTKTILFAALGSLLAITAACGDDDDDGEPTNPDNVVTNPSFEDGADGWNARSGEPTVSGDEANSGDSSLLVSLELGEDASASGAEFVYQETNPEVVPEFLSFDYYVDDWVRGTDGQYIEAVVVVGGSGAGMPDCPGGEPCPNIQMRYVLSGVTSIPTEVLNARWEFVGEEEPATGEWLHFETDLRNDMTEAWRSLPNDVEYVRIQLEVRYDDKDPGEQDLAADVYWDNIYLGPR